MSMAETGSTTNKVEITNNNYVLDSVLINKDHLLGIGDINKQSMRPGINSHEPPQSDELHGKDQVYGLPIREEPASPSRNHKEPPIILFYYDSETDESYAQEIMDLVEKIFDMKNQEVNIVNFDEDRPTGMSEHESFDNFLQKCHKICIIISRNYLAQRRYTFKKDMALEAMLMDERLRHSLIVISPTDDLTKEDLPRDLQTLAPIMKSERYYESRLKRAFVLHPPNLASSPPPRHRQAGDSLAFTCTVTDVAAVEDPPKFVGRKKSHSKRRRIKYSSCSASLSSNPKLNSKSKIASSSAPTLLAPPETSCSFSCSPGSFDSDDFFSYRPSTQLKPHSCSCAVQEKLQMKIINRSVSCEPAIQEELTTTSFCHSAPNPSTPINIPSKVSRSTLTEELQNGQDATENVLQKDLDAATAITSVDHKLDRNFSEKDLESTDGILRSTALASFLQRVTERFKSI